MRCLVAQSNITTTCKTVGTYDCDYMGISATSRLLADNASNVATSFE